MTSSALSPAAAPDAPDQPSLQTLREEFRTAKAKQIALLHNPALGRRSVRGVLHHFSELADGLLRTLWQRAQMPQGAALLAVGGYGRAQLFPYSDIDVLVLLPQSSAQPAADRFSATVMSLISSATTGTAANPQRRVRAKEFSTPASAPTAARQGS